MQLFLAAALQNFVITDILGHLLATKHRNWFQLVINNRISKLVETSSLTNILVGTIVEPFADNWVLVFSRPIWPLSDNRYHFSIMFFHTLVSPDMWRACSQRLTIRSVSNRSSYLIERSQKRYATTSPITQGNDIYTQALSRMRTERKSILQPDVPNSSYRCLAHLDCWPWDRRYKINRPSRQRNKSTGGSTGLQNGCRKEAREWRWPKKSVRRFLQDGPPAKWDHRAWNIRVREEGIYIRHDKKHKHPSVIEGLFRVVAVTDTTGVVLIGDRQKRLPNDRVVVAPLTADLLRGEVPKMKTRT